MVLLQIGVFPDVRFISYPVVNRYRSLDEAVADCMPLFGDGWDKKAARHELERMLVSDGDELLYDGGISVSGVAHWQPRAS
jgi:hypothetical protein